MPTEAAPSPDALIAELDALRPAKGPAKSTCKWLMAADPAQVDAIRSALARGNTHTSVGKKLRSLAALVTIDGIRDHLNAQCETCGVSLK